jgi:hypothetical protein
VTLATLATVAIDQPAQAANFYPVDISTFYNDRIQIGSPAGNVTLGGIPFQLGVSGNNVWNSYYPVNAPNPRSIDIGVNIFGVSEVNTLINTLWGKPGPSSYASLEFFGSAGAYYKKDLVSNIDIRDFKVSYWTNSINGTTTTQVWTGNVPGQGTYRLDKQQITLPATFLDQTLTTIRMSDYGAAEFQRTFLSGVTVTSVGIPEPTTILGTTLAIGLAGVVRRKRAKHITS